MFKQMPTISPSTCSSTRSFAPSSFTKFDTALDPEPSFFAQRRKCQSRFLLRGKAVFNSRLPSQYNIEWRIGIARDGKTSAKHTAGILRTPAKVHVTLGFQGSVSELHDANSSVFPPRLYSQAQDFVDEPLRNEVRLVVVVEDRQYCQFLKLADPWMTIDGFLP